MTRTKWIVLFCLLLLALLLDLVIPDPIPVIDEFILITGTLFSAYKTIITEE